MAQKFRRMESYRPRKRRTKQELQRIKLQDMQRQISTHVGRFLVIMKEGNHQQLDAVRIKAQADFLKRAPEMRQLSQHMNRKIALVVQSYLNTVHSLFYSHALSIDPATIDECYQTGRQLDRELHVA